MGQGLAVVLLVLVAEPAPVELAPAVVEVEPLAETPLTTGTATVLIVEPAAASSVGELLSSVPGVVVRRTGGLGSFTTLTLRGLGAENVNVVLDDLPLAAATLGPVDLSLLAIDDLDRIEVHRGLGPTRFAGPLGGVVHLRSERASSTPRLRLRAGYGSFDDRLFAATATGPLGPLAYVAHASYRGTSGDFRYYFRNETPYAVQDDDYRRRANNGSDALAARVSVSREALGGTLRTSVAALARTQGVAGPGDRPTEEAHARDLEVVARAAVNEAAALESRLLWSAGLDALYAAREFDDPRDEVGLTVRRSVADLLQVGADGRLAWLWSAEHETELAPRVTVELFEQSGRASSPVSTDAAQHLRRASLGAGLEHRWDVARLRVVPAVRADAQSDEGVQAIASPRLGALVELGSCELRANGGGAHRFPTLLERYGDGVTTTASLALAPERLWTADAGGSCASRIFGLRRARVDAAVFWSEARDLIVVQRNSQLMGASTNVESARLRGVEASVVAEHRMAALELAYALTDARDEGGVLRGKRAPGVPLHDASAGLTVGPEVAQVRYDVSAVSTTYLDRANLLSAPPRLLHDLTLTSRLTDVGLTLTLAVRNLADAIVAEAELLGSSAPLPQPVADFLGYPLPGRSVFFTVAWSGS